ncbi:MAG: SpoIIE family protein phosphatase [Anaerolineae bacterium]|nr:SpoIIE family protein phosphatase [Anaerolineae bacterium]
MPTPSNPSSTEHLALLYNLFKTVGSSLDLDEVLNQVMDEVITAIRAERGFIVLRANDGSLEFWAARGLNQENIQEPDAQVSHSLIEKVLAEGSSLLTLDAQQEEVLKDRESVMGLRLKAVLCSPLVTKGKVIGAIYLDNRLKEGAFSQNDSALLEAIAGTAAMVIENARLFQHSQSQVKTLHLLYDINTDLTATLDLERVLTTSLERIQDTLGTAACSILTLEGDELVFQVAIGEKSEEIKPFRIPTGHGIAGWVVENAEGVIVNDVEQDPRFFSGADEETGFVTKQLMAAPMIVNDQTLGVIEVFNKPGGFGEADLELLKTIAGSAAIALENARLYLVAVEKGRMEQELQMARRVQTSLIPDKVPRRKGWEFAARWVPAREVSGDYYDFIQGNGKKVGVLIADVTDKGMPAALFMAFSRSILRASLDHSESPGKSVTYANEMICADSTIGMPVTAFYALLDPASGQMTYVNAGHNPPLHFRAKDGRLVELKATGMLLGAIEEAEYGEAVIELGAGDMVVFFTDGIPDAINKSKEDFGEARLKALVQEHANKSAQEMIDVLENSILEFIDENAQFDDITMVVVKRL